jgi:hypothetical protein
MVHLSLLAEIIAATCGHGHSAFAAHWAPLKRFRRLMLMPVFCVPDSAFFGLKPLRTHILICGFPRAGTTLMQMMLENAHPGARRFGREVGGWRAATYSLRNHSIMISKVPHDIARLDALRRHYAGRRAQLKIIAMIRDPRNILTSQRTLDGILQYVVCPARWRFYYRNLLEQREKEDVLIVRYEDLVSDVECEQARIEEFTGEKVTYPFRMFHEFERTDFDTSTLNGLRPVEKTLLDRWREPMHRPRIQQVLRELPELPQALIDLGYEADNDWINQIGLA